MLGGGMNDEERDKDGYKNGADSGDTHNLIK